MKKLTLLLSLFFCTATFAQSAEQKLKEMNLPLPEIKKPGASYVHAVRSGNLLYLSGKGPTTKEGKTMTGKVGKDLTIEEGQLAAKITGYNLLAVLKNELGSLDKVKRIVKVLGMVNSAPDFYDQPKVINGFSDLMIEIFGEKGSHARSAVGMVSLPSNIAVEIEMIVEIED